MKTLIRTFALLIASASLALAGGSGWLEKYDKAVEQAKKEDKPILVDFTGSDWCGWCIKLDKEVFSKEAFKDYAKEKLVLLELDFPQQKRQSRSLKRQNEELAKKYKVEGFPTILLIDAEGKVLARTGYQEGGAEAYVKHLKGLLEKADMH